MEARYKSLSIFEFQSQFDTQEKCLDYLVKMKWGHKYECPKCKNTKYGKGLKPHDRQCSKCNYCESPTAGTLFHKVKFDIVKAFYIVYFVSTNKKGITSTELSRKLNLRQKTCWLFKRKVMKAMESSGNYLLEGNVEVDEMVVGGQEESTRGRQNKKKKLVVIAIEKKKKGVSRFYAKVIDKASAKNLGAFMKQTISAKAIIKTDQWSGYKPLEKDFENLTHIESGKKGEALTRDKYSGYYKGFEYESNKSWYIDFDSKTGKGGHYNFANVKTKGAVLFNSTYDAVMDMMKQLNNVYDK